MRSRQGKKATNFPKNNQEPRDTALKTGEGKAFLQGVISVFILFHLVAIICWATPIRFLPFAAVNEMTRPYMLWTGLFQSWDTFAPDPVRTNTYVKAIVITQKGHVRVWSFPRMDQLGFGQRYEKERYRKFVEDVLREQNALLLPDVARHIARFYNDPADRPQKVLLIKFQTDITPGSEHEREPKPTEFYDEDIDPEDLR
jgi:hypothetical protein